MGKTKIQWADYSWPVINGCMRKSAGCENCYAERLTATRLSKTPKYGGLAVMKPNGPHWTGEVRLHEKSLLDPLRIKKPSRIFVCDMGDLFYEAVPDEWIDKVFAVMALCPQHTFQVLTKRPERMRDYVKEIVSVEASANRIRRAINEIPAKMGDRRGALELPLFNVWLGVSCEDQVTAEQRIPILMHTPAAKTFISAEPLLGPIDLEILTHGPDDGGGWIYRHWNALDGSNWCDCQDFIHPIGTEPLSWVIVGGESGPGARSLDLNWIKQVVSQCQAANIPVFVKQIGYRPWWDGVSTRAPGDHVYLEAGVVVNGKVGWQFDCMKDRKGGLIDEWPEDLKVREFPK